MSATTVQAWLLLLNDVSIQKKLSTKIENANLPLEMADLDIETALKAV